MNTAMQKLTLDLEHTFVLDRLDQERNTKDRGMKTLFKIEKFGGDRLSFTTMGHLPYIKNSKESEFIYVVYELQEDKENPGIKHLYRGATAFMPENFDEPIPMELLVKNVKSFVVQPWNGDRWSKEKWDTKSGSTSNKMPRMVMLKLEVYLNDLENPDDETNNQTDMISTVVYLQRMRDFAEEKKGAVNFKWF